MEELFHSQAEIAAICKVTQQSISNWKVGIRFPNSFSKRQLTEILSGAGRSIEEFRKADPLQDPCSGDQAENKAGELFNSLSPEKKEYFLELVRYEYRQLKIGKP